jgi:WD40 repeat protein
MAAPSGRPSFSPDGTGVLSGYEDGAVRVWNPAAGTTRSLPGYDKPSQAAYSRDGAFVVSAPKEEPGVVRLWNLESGKSQVVPSVKGDKYGLAVDSTGSRVAIATLDKPTVVERPNGTGRVELHGYTADVYALAFSPDGRHVVSASEDKTARIWNAQTGRQERSLHHNEAVADATYSRNGRYVATAGFDGTVRVWPVAGGRPVLLYGHVGQVNTVAFDASGQRLVTAGTDGTVRIWDSAGGEALAILNTHDQNALGAGFSPDGASVVSAGENGAVQITPCEVCGSLADVLKLAGLRAKRALSPIERERLLSGDG